MSQQAAARLPAQAATGPLGVADTTARNLVDGAVRNQKLSSTHPFVAAVRHAYERLPVAARAAAVTAAFAWAKTYVSSAAFSTTYAAARQKARPAALPPDEMTVDAELKGKLDEQRAKIAEIKQAAATLPTDARAEMLALAKSLEDGLTDPERLKILRDEIEGRRANNARGVNEQVAKWNEAFPPTSRDLVKRELARFLDVSARVDFTIPITPFKSPDGVIVGFAAPLEQQLGWIEIECMLAGHDMVSAGRAAAEAWLKEIST